MGTLPRVAGHARNPGLCNRNSYRVAKGCPSPSLPRGGSPYMLCFRVFEWCSIPLGKAGMGLLCLLVRTPGNSYSVAVGCVPSTMYFGLKLHTENLIIIPHGMPWGIIVLILMTPALPCLLLSLIKSTNHGIKIHILRNFNPHFTEKCLVNVLLELPLWACHPRWICCMLPSSACRHRWISQLVCPWQLCRSCDFPAQG